MWCTRCSCSRAATSAWGINTKGFVPPIILVKVVVIVINLSAHVDSVYSPVLSIPPTWTGIEWLIFHVPVNLALFSIALHSLNLFAPKSQTYMLRITLITQGELAGDLEFTRGLLVGQINVPRSQAIHIRTNSILMSVSMCVSDAVSDQFINSQCCSLSCIHLNQQDHFWNNCHTGYLDRSSTVLSYWFYRCMWVN